MNIKNKALISSVIILIIVFLSCCYYYISRVQPYNQFLNHANQAMSSEKYDKAVILYSKALNYKKDSEVSKKIELSELLKMSKETYDTAIQFMNNKDYLAAINSFKKVAKQDSKRYSNAQDKISECTKSFIAENLKSANENFTNNKFDQANTYLNNILKVDANNSDAKKLKDSIEQAIQKQKENETVSKEQVTKDN